MLPAVESPHKKAKMEQNQKADFSESKFVKFYKASANKPGSNEDIEAGCTSLSQSPPRRTQITTSTASDKESPNYAQNLTTNEARLNYPNTLEAGSRFSPNFECENKENLATEFLGKLL